MTRKVTLALLASAALLSVPLAAEPAPVQSEDVLGLIARQFAQEVAKLPVSAFDERCSFSSAEDLLGRYFKAAEADGIATARSGLYDLFVQLRCVSARRFAGLHRAFSRVALQRAGVDGEAKQILAPVALLFFELGYGEFRIDIIRWLFDNAEELGEAIEEEGSRLSRIGLFAREYDRLWQLDPEGQRLLLDSVGTLAFGFGDCSLMEMIPIEDETEERIWMCPRGCGWDVATELAHETDLDLASFLAPEAQEICEEYNRAREDKPRLGHAVLECGRQFVESAGDDFLACQVDAFATRGALLADFDTERTREDIYAARRCFRSQANAGARLHQLARERNEASNRLLATWRVRDLYRAAAEGHLRAAGSFERIVVAEVGEERYLDPDFDDWCRENCSSEARAALQGVNDSIDGAREANNAADRAEELAGFLEDFLDRNIEEIRRLQEEIASGEGQCAPDSTGCSDSCGILDQMAQDTSACLQEASAQDLPDRGGLPPGPRTQPDPLGPEEVEGALGDLEQCLMAAGGRDDTPETPPSTCPHYTMCPNGEMPHGENCRCGVDQRYSGVPDGCLMVAQCTDSPLICCPRPVEPGDVLGGGGGVLGPPGGDPSPVGERVRVLLSRSLAGRIPGAEGPPVD